MSDAIEYTINGVVYTQDFLTISQTIQVAKILQGIHLNPHLEKGDFQIITILETLEKSGVLEKLFNIVLDGPEPIKINQVKPAIAIKVITDFFSLNDILEIISTVVDLMSTVNENSDHISSLMNQMPATANLTGTG